MGANKKRRTFTREFKAEVVQRVHSGGQKHKQVALELGLSESTVRAWVRQAEIDQGHAPPAAASVQEQVRTVTLQEERSPAAVLEAALASLAPPAPLPTTPAVVEAPARTSTFRLIEAQARLPRKPTHRPQPAQRQPVAVPQAPTTLRRVALLAGAAVPLLVVGFLFLSRPAEGEPAAVTAPTAAPSAAAAAVASAEAHYVARFPPPPGLTASSAPAPAASTPPNTPPTTPGTTPETTVGTIVTTAVSHDHRIFVDGRTVGATGETIEVRCGHHQARYGSEGRMQDIVVPCGGQVTLEPSWGGVVRAAGSSAETEEEIYPMGEP